MAVKLLAATVIILISCVSVEAALFSDNFDVDSSANWNILTSSADTSVTFAFDYSTVGVPASPNGGGSTLGVRMAANIVSPTGAEAVTLSPVGQSFSGSYQLKFDMWVNANGPFPGGGAGSTEFFTTGIGHDDTTVNRGGATGTGGWFAVTGEGGSSRDYRAYKGAGEQFAESGQFLAGNSSAGGGAHNASDPHYAAFGNIDVAVAVPLQGQTGITGPGTAAFAWHEVTVTVDGATALWSIDGLDIARLDPTIGADFALNGNIAVGYMDIFSSVSGDSALSFGLIDNLEVVVFVPEPATMTMFLMGGLALLRRRRR